MAWEGKDWQKLDSIDTSLRSIVRGYDDLLSKFDLLIDCMAGIKTALESSGKND